MSIRRIILLTALIGLILSSACEKDMLSVVVENRTSAPVTVLRQNDTFVRGYLDPGQSIQVGELEHLWNNPSRVRAIDPAGNVVFDREITLEELRSSGYHIVIE